MLKIQDSVFSGQWSYEITGIRPFPVKVTGKLERGKPEMKKPRTDARL